MIYSNSHRNLYTLFDQLDSKKPEYVFRISGFLGIVGSDVAEALSSPESSEGMMGLDSNSGPSKTVRMDHQLHQILD